MSHMTWSTTANASDDFLLIALLDACKCEHTNTTKQYSQKNVELNELNEGAEIDRSVYIQIELKCLEFRAN